MRFKEFIVSYFSLFTSVSTLLCCALPSLLVALGFGAVVAGVVSTVPQLVWLSEHKVWVFAIAGVMLGIGAIAQKRAQNLPCPIDPNQARSCMRARRASLGIFIFSVGIYLIGMIFAFGAPLFLS